MKERSSEMMTADFDISEVLRIELNNAIVKTLKKNPTTKVLNLDELRTDEIAEYFNKNGSINQLEWVLEKGSSFDLARWFKIVLGELHTIAANKQG